MPLVFHPPFLVTIWLYFFVFVAPTIAVCFGSYPQYSSFVCGDADPLGKIFF